MMGPKICFYGEMRLIIPKLSLLLLIWITGLLLKERICSSRSVLIHLNLDLCKGVFVYLHGDTLHDTCHATYHHVNTPLHVA